MASKAVPSRDFPDGDDASVKKHWALIVAGSAGWSNYRHQADACHAYQVLRRGGFHAQHIVTMMYNDIANNAENPMPGQIFNRPGGQDVYAGVRIDYSGEEVSAANLLAVLEGNATAVMNVGTGRVIASGPHDRIFLFYSDHGSPGVLGMPSGDFLYADQLMQSLRRKHHRRGYAEAVLYIEACESGSMFEGLLDNSLAIYATTAANAFESSWGTYCPGMDPEPAEQFTTCLGDLYSVAWMENAEGADLSYETVREQVDLVTRRTSNNYTYMMGSHVMEYGNLEIARELAGDYQGMHNNGATRPSFPGRFFLRTSGAAAAAAAAARAEGSGSSRQSTAALGRRRSRRALIGDGVVGGAMRVAGGSGGSGELQLHARGGGKGPKGHHRRVKQRAADLVPLQMAVRRADGEGAAARAQAALDAAVSHRRAIDTAVARAALRLLTSAPALSTRLAEQLAAAASAGDVSAVNNAAGSSSGSDAGNVDAGSVDEEDDVLYSGSSDLGDAIVQLPRIIVEQLQQLHGDVMARHRAASGRAVVDDWDCLRGMVAAWERGCGRLGQYGMRHTRLFANLCNLGASPAALHEALQAAPCGPLASAVAAY